MTGRPPLDAAVFAALGAGARVIDSRPRTLDWSGAWVTAVSAEAIVELLTGDAERVGRVLAWACDLADYMAHYRRALAEHNERDLLWWRRRLFEDCRYTGPFPGEASPA